MPDKNPKMSQVDPDFILEALSQLFGRIPQARPFERELNRLDPRNLQVPAADLQACQDFYELIDSEIAFLMDAYLTAMREAERHPHAPSIALDLLSAGLHMGQKEFETWQKTPQAVFAGMLPRDFMESTGLGSLADLLLD